MNEQAEGVRRWELVRREYVDFVASAAREIDAFVMEFISFMQRSGVDPEPAGTVVEKGSGRTQWSTYRTVHKYRYPRAWRLSDRTIVTPEGRVLTRVVEGESSGGLMTAKKKTVYGFTPVTIRPLDGSGGVDPKLERIVQCAGNLGVAGLRHEQRPNLYFDYRDSDSLTIHSLRDQMVSFASRHTSAAP